MEMEQALLQAERRAEQEQVEAENEIISQLQFRLTQLDKATQKEKEKVSTHSTKRRDASTVSLPIAAGLLHVNEKFINMCVCFRIY